MAYTSVTSECEKVYTWTDDPDYQASATTESDTILKALSIYNTDGTFGIHFASDGSVDALLAFVTFAKNVLTDLETELTVMP